MSATAVEQEIRNIHDLLSVSHLLADRGVAPEKLARYDAAIANARKRLDAVRQSVAVEGRSLTSSNR